MLETGVYVGKLPKGSPQLLTKILNKEHLKSYLHTKGFANSIEQSLVWISLLKD